MGNDDQPIVPLEAAERGRPSGVLVTAMVAAVAVVGFLIIDSRRADAPGGPSAAPAPPGTGLPATTLFVIPSPGSVPYTGDVPTQVDAPCPQSFTGPMGSDPSGMLAESSRLEPMIGQVLDYGGEHADQFGSYGLIWHDAGDASVFISFTGDLDAHRAALEQLVAVPDELIVCQVALSSTDSQALQSSLLAEFPGRILSISQGSGAIAITLPADEEQLAAELFERYGFGVQLTVGALQYPIEEAESVCAPLPAGSAPDGLELAVVPPAGPLPVTGAEQWSLEVQLTNVGDVPISFGSGIATGTVLDLAGNVVSGPSGIGIADVGIQVDLAPGASQTIPMMAGSSSCDPSLGYSLPPGDYQLVGSVQHSEGDTTFIVTPPIPITISG